ncbi:hypothetical protein EDB83DRAFT_2479961, partial [Lactarius deliciosus]
MSFFFHCFISPCLIALLPVSQHPSSPHHLATCKSMAAAPTLRHHHPITHHASRRTGCAASPALTRSARCAVLLTATALLHGLH